METLSVSQYGAIPVTPLGLVRFSGELEYKYELVVSLLVFPFFSSDLVSQVIHTFPPVTFHL
jgi:hypothetical protein